MGEQDSLSPHLIGVVKSRRARGWMKWAVLALISSSSAAWPVFRWFTTRYDRESAEGLTKRVGVLEGLVGTRQLQLSCEQADPTLSDDASLQDRVRALDRWKRCVQKEMEEHDKELYRRIVSLAAASSEKRPALRAAAARAAVEKFNAGIGAGASVSQAAAAALETRIPGQ